ncbi:MAG: cytochrome c3 family protein [Planctomycetes bacterium]|nr:cytochrome c3 family protein [Planctomycetota bacterium]
MKKGWGSLLASAAIAALFLVGSVPAFAQKFHEPGNLVCTQCHTLHNSENGAAIDPAGPNHGLLKAELTDLCLSCHDTAGSNALMSWGGSTPPKVKGTVTNELPGGNFSYSFATPSNGHSPMGTGFNEPTLTVAPGGTVNGGYPRTELECTSCHGPHGVNSGIPSGYTFEYRNLKKRMGNFGATPAITLGTSTEVTNSVIGSGDGDEADIVTAGAAADQNAAIGATNHNVYKGEMGKWCGSCHSNTDDVGTGFHGTTLTDPDTADLVAVEWSRHPTGTAFRTSFATAYGANSNFAYPIVTTAAAASTTAEWPVVAAESFVFCLSCHKAHASEYPNALRWDLTSGSGGTSNNRAKCGKCHNR